MRKYKTIQVKGHPRAGNHYLAALIDCNFFNGNDYIKHVICPPGGFKFPHRYGGQDFKSDDVLVIYIWRNFVDTGKSIFKMRKRFGLQEDDYKVFQTRKLSEMWMDDKPCKMRVNTMHNKRIVTEVDTLFNDVDMTFKEYWDYHTQSWFSLRLDNVIYVNYESLVKETPIILRNIARKFGSKKNRFVDVSQKVGWSTYDTMPNS